jgi:hypothetical protein
MITVGPIISFQQYLLILFLRIKSLLFFVKKNKIKSVLKYKI